MDQAPWKLRHLAAVLCALLLAACSGGEDGGDSGPGREIGLQEDPSPDRKRMEAIRSIPYFGGSASDSNEAGGVVFRDATRSNPGFDLYEIQSLCRVELMDETGQVVRAWSHAPSGVFEHAELLPNGDLLVIGADETNWHDGRALFRIGDDARYLLRFNWQGELLWKRHLTAHHDVEVLEDGHLLALTFQRRLVDYIDPSIPTRDDAFTLLDAQGHVLESRSMLDAFARKVDAFPLARIESSELGGPPWIDLFHSNSLEWMRHESLFAEDSLYGPSRLIACYRHQDRIAIYDWELGEFVWSWGQGILSGPHDAQLLATGNILVFDNGLARERSRGLEMDPRTGQIVWEYEAEPVGDFFTMTKGSIQRLPNGNTLLAESDAGRAFEITPQGERVWEFLCPHRTEEGERAAIVRMRRFPREFIEAIERQHGG